MYENLADGHRKLTFGLILIIVGVIHIGVADAGNQYAYTIQYYDVPIDHFSFSSNYTFKMRWGQWIDIALLIDISTRHITTSFLIIIHCRHARYLTNDTYKRNSRSPIFFYTGNEGSIELFAQNTGFMWEIAEEFGASLGSHDHSCIYR